MLNTKVKNTFLFLSIITSQNLVAEQQTLEPIFVTATRTPQTIDQATASVTLITRKDIANSTATDLSELLTSLAGFDIRTSGPYGKSTSIFMRGTNSDHILTMIDGIKIYSATLGNTAFQHLPLSQIERIEIVRGPRGSLYGSEAIGGVIQIFTRKGKDVAEVNANIEFGSNNTQEISAGVSGANDSVSYSFYASQFDSDGIDAIQHSTPNDDDGYDNTSVSAQLGYHFNKMLKADVHLLNAQGTTLYDGCSSSLNNCTKDFTQQAINSSLIITPQGIWDGKLGIGTSIDDSDNFNDNIASSSFKTTHTSIALQNNIQLTDRHLLTLGIDYANDEIDSTTNYAIDERDNTGIYIQWSAALNKINLNTSLRSDNNEQFGKHTSGNIAAGFDITKNLNLFTAYGTAFKAPTFNDLYWPGAGNASLQPEQAETLEFGLRQDQHWGKWSVNIYTTEIKNLISGWPPANTAKASIDGIEFTSSGQWGRWNIDFTASYTDPRNDSGTNVGKVLPKRVKQSSRLEIKRKYDQYLLGISAIAQGQRFNNRDNTEKLPGYGIINLFSSYQLNKNITFKVKINNAFDKDYVLNSRTSFFSGTTIYNTLDRNIFVSMQYKM
jgi:vitamin B12 transporter